MPHATAAKLCHPDRPGGIADAWREALSADRPVLLEMMTDPSVPPHLGLKQVAHYAKALLQGDPDAKQLILATMRETWDDLVGGRG